MTMCRRNWHLLPIDQLATLLNATPDQLMNFLQVEEMANWVILAGSSRTANLSATRPPMIRCSNVRTRIKQIVEEYFGEEIREPGEPRFDFVRRLDRPRVNFVLPRRSAPNDCSRRDSSART